MSDLSKLPRPVFVSNDPTARVADFIARYQADTGKILYPAQPERLLIDLIAYADANLRAAIQYAGEQNLLAYAEGAALDNLGAFFNVTRLAGETDAALRERTRLAPEAFSVAGPAGAYRYFALSAHPDVSDAYADSPAPGIVRVTVLSKTGLPTQSVLDAVQSACSAEIARPLCDTVQTAAPSPVDYTLTAQIQPSAGFTQALIEPAVTAAANTYAAGKSARLGSDITRSQIMAALNAIPGVHRVAALTSPASDLILTRLQWARCTGVTLTWLAASDE